MKHHSSVGNPRVPRSLLYDKTDASQRPRDGLISIDLAPWENRHADKRLINILLQTGMKSLELESSWCSIETVSSSKRDAPNGFRWDTPVRPSNVETTENPIPGSERGEDSLLSLAKYQTSLVRPRCHAPAQHCPGWLQQQEGVDRVDQEELVVA